MAEDESVRAHRKTRHGITGVLATATFKFGVGFFLYGALDTGIPKGWLTYNLWKDHALLHGSNFGTQVQLGIWILPLCALIEMQKGSEQSQSLDVLSWGQWLEDVQ